MVARSNKGICAIALGDDADALLLATIKAVGIIQPPIVFTGPDGGNGLMIENGHRRRDGAMT